MRIVFIGYKHIPSREGGTEIVVDELAIRMVACGEQVAVYNRKDHNAVGKELDNQSNTSDKPYMHRGVKVVPVTTIDAKGLAALTSSFFATLKAIKARPNVIHYHTEGPCVSLRLARWAGIRTAATIHGLDRQRTRWGRLASMYLKLGERTAAKCTDEVVVLSRSVQQYFKNTHGQETRLILNGITPVESVSPDVTADRWNLEKDSYVLFLGRIIPEEGVHYFIEAFEQLNIDKEPVIASGASDSAKYYKSIKQAVTEDQHIILAGFIKGRELEELYGNTYIYVLPSDLEGMLMSPSKALAYGCCCLTFSIAECADMLRDCLLYASSSPRDAIYGNR